MSGDASGPVTPVTSVTPATEDLPDTGNYPEPQDGPQDDVEQTTLPDFDEDLVDGADLEADDEDLPGDRSGANDPLRDDA